MAKRDFADMISISDLERNSDCHVCYVSSEEPRALWLGAERCHHRKPGRGDQKAERDVIHIPSPEGGPGCGPGSVGGRQKLEEPFVGSLLESRDPGPIIPGNRALPTTRRSKKGILPKSSPKAHSPPDMVNLVC